MKTLVSPRVCWVICIVTFFACQSSVFAQKFDIESGTSVFVFKPAKKLRRPTNTNFNSGSNSARTVNSVNKAITNTKGSGKIPVNAQKSAIDETLAPEEWVNEVADNAIEENKIVDDEPFLSLTEGDLNSRMNFCESPQFPAAARAAKSKLVRLKVLVTVAKYGGVLRAKVIEGDAAFRSAVYKTLENMVFRQSLFMGQPVRIEGILTFTQNPANTVLCRDTSQEVKIPAIIDGGVLNNFAKACDAAQLPDADKNVKSNDVSANVRVMVDEKGNVVFAETVSSSGDETFLEAAKIAAMKAVFPRSYITNILVKVRGELVFTQNANNTVISCQNTTKD